MPMGVTPVKPVSHKAKTKTQKWNGSLKQEVQLNGEGVSAGRSVRSAGRSVIGLYSYMHEVQLNGG